MPIPNALLIRQNGHRFGGVANAGDHERAEGKTA